jgi:DNA-directed RNA polymerase subunit beta'
VIIGKLIPAGTGLDRYTQVDVEPTDEAKAKFYSGPSAFSGFDYAATDALGGDYSAMSMDDYGYGQDFR